jgi:hypothetical protein
MMWLSLALISMACGVGVGWLFRRTSNRDAVRRSRKRVYAHLLEFRLFADEPRLVFRAQIALIVENVRLCLLLAPAAILAGVPLAWIALQLDAIYGSRPLRVGQAAIVTVQMEKGIALDDPPGSLEGPPGISVETPPVRDFTGGQISWRIRAAEAVHGRLKLTLGSNIIEKNISAGDRTIFLARRRVRSWFQFLLHPEEPRIPAPGVAWVGVDYPKKESWLVWFLALSTASAVVLGRYA